mgnify:CR=1 FL=1
MAKKRGAEVTREGQGGVDKRATSTNLQRAQQFAAREGREWAKMSQQAEAMAALPQTQAGAQGGPGQMGAVPDAGAMALSPNGAGAALGTELPMQGGPVSVMQAAPSVPTQAAGAQMGPT